MTDDQVLLAQRQREDALLEDFIDARLALIFSEADTVGPDARRKLSGILKHYAKNPHPFRACVRDNMKRFGPGRTERVCAVLKDIIRGTTHWRHGPDSGAAGLALDEETEKILLSIPDEKLDMLMLEAQEFTHAR